MKGLILIENLFMQDYHQNKLFIQQQMMEKEVKVMVIFLVINIHIQKMYGKNLDLKMLEIFMNTTSKKMYYY